MSQEEQEQQKIFLDPKFFRTKNSFQTQNFFQTKYFFWLKNYSDPIFFKPKYILTPHFFWNWMFFRTNIFIWPKIIFVTQFFSMAKIVLTKKKIYQNFCLTHLIGHKQSALRLLVFIILQNIRYVFTICKIFPWYRNVWWSKSLSISF